MDTPSLLPTPTRLPRELRMDTPKVLLFHLLWMVLPSLLIPGLTGLLRLPMDTVLPMATTASNHRHLLDLLDLIPPLRSYRLFPLPFLLLKTLFPSLSHQRVRVVRMSIVSRVSIVSIVSRVITRVGSVTRIRFLEGSLAWKKGIDSRLLSIKCYLNTRLFNLSWILLLLDSLGWKMNWGTNPKDHVIGMLVLSLFWINLFFD